MARFSSAMAALFLLLAVQTICAAATYDWPGPAPCNTPTLNACVADASVQDGDTVTLSPDFPIAETLDLTKAISFRAASGYRPVFAAGYGILDRGTAAVTIDGITFLGGYIYVDTSSSVTIRHVDLTVIADDSSNVGIIVAQASNIEIADNVVHGEIHPRDMDVIEAQASVSAGTLSIHDNRLYGHSDARYRSDVYMSSFAGSVVLFYANQLNDVSVYANINPSVDVDIADNAIVCTAQERYGLDARAPAGASVNVFNNTISGCTYASFGAETPSSGRISGNIVANMSDGLRIAGAATNDHNLVFNNMSNSFTPGPGTINADPQFVRPGNTRLTGSSPAIDASDPTALATLLSAHSLPAIDADGLRRFKGPDGIPDIGAFEFGDSSLIVTSVAGDTIVDPGLGTLPQYVQSSLPGSVSQPAQAMVYTGLKPISGHRHLIREDTGNSPEAGLTFDVFAPGSGSGQFIYVSTASNIAGFATRIVNPATDGHPERIVIATLDGASLFNHPFATAYIAGNWYIQQLDAQTGDPDFPTGLHFNIYAQDPSLNAFLAKTETPTGSIRLLHPVLNYEPCGRMIVGNSQSNANPIAVFFFSEAWKITNTDFKPIAANAQFPVIVDEASTAACRYDHLFNDDFELHVVID